MEQQPLVEETTDEFPSKCGCCCGSPPSHISDQFVKKYLDNDVRWGYWSMPPRNQQTLDTQRQRLEDREAFPTTSLVKSESTMERGFASAKDMVSILYQATKAQGLFEEIPEPLRGVFWMKDNGVGEELCVLQWGKWYEKEKLLLTPFAPLMWAWADGVPKNAPFGGTMYGPQTVVTSARLLLGSGKPPPDDDGTACLSFKFNSGLTYGTLQGHTDDVREDTVSVPFCSCIRGLFTMELLESESLEPGSRWKRGCYWGPGNCTALEFGSYTLTKVVKGNGEPNEPYYSEFLEYMGDVRLFCWSGFVDEPEQAPTGCC